MKTSAVIVCAGSSCRFGQDKLQLMLDGQTPVQHTVHTMAQHAAIDQIIVVVNADQVTAYTQLLGGGCIVTAGGDTRAQSVQCGLALVTNPWVLVHDGARPGASLPLIDRVLCALTSATDGRGVIPTVPLVDSMIDSDGHYVPRQQYRAVQTPQGFVTQNLRQAFRQARPDDTDEGSMYGRLFPLQFVEGDINNRKITYPIDAYGLLGRTANGVGYDIHTLVPFRPLVLCGTPIPCDKGCLGHSDADVCLHAVMDAILSTTADGDIGHWFPTDDPQWAGADSKELCRIVLHNLYAKGGTVTHVSLSVVAPYPRLAPHLDTMRRSLAALLSLSIDCVGITVTTNEGVAMQAAERLAPTPDAIACIAMVPVRLPTTAIARS